MFQELMKLCHLIVAYRELALDADVRPSDRVDRHSYFNRELRELDKQACELGIPGIRPVETREGMR